VLSCFAGSIIWGRNGQRETARIVPCAAPDVRDICVYLAPQLRKHAEAGKAAFEQIWTKTGRVMTEPTTIRGATARLLRVAGRFAVRYVRGVLILSLISVARGSACSGALL
jgi:hypothetical protein